MLKYFLLVGLLIPNPESQAKEANLCSPLNHCVIEKKSWVKNGWAKAYSKELSFDKFCDQDRPQLQAEDDLGLELWVFPGDEKASEPLKKKPYVTVNLHADKLTYVVASASVPTSATMMSFTHRLKPRGNAIVEVSCSAE